MECPKCNNKIFKTVKFCGVCGENLTSFKTKDKFKKFFVIGDFFGKTTASRITSLLIILVIVGFNLNSQFNNKVVEENNIALNKFDSGNFDGAIEDLEELKEGSVKKSQKIGILKNLAYSYSGDENYAKSLESFREALGYTSEGEFDYFLILGEIAYLEGKPNSALLNYKKAYDLEPNDIQINNALNLFYLDLDELYPNHIDYPQALIHAQKTYNSESGLQNTTLGNLALAYFFNENYSESLKLYLQKTSITPDDNLMIGTIYVALEDFVNAEIYLRKSVDSGYVTWEEISEMYGI